MVPVGDQEPAPVGLQRVLDSGRDVDGHLGRVGRGPGADVRDGRGVVWPVHLVDAVDGAAADIGADQGHQNVGGVVEEGDVHRATQAGQDLPGRPVANVVVAPVRGSTREIRPTAASVT